MYLTFRASSLEQPGPADLAVQVPPGPEAARARVGSTVVLLGSVSLLTDLSSEAVTAILPLYLTAVLGLGPLAYGIVDGLYQGVSTVVRVAGGIVSDRSGRPKWVAFAGYALSALSRLALLPVQSLTVVSAVLTVDRLGKGLRTAPRDALLCAASPPSTWGRAFGVHRAMDTVGATAGPLLAFAVLLAVPGGYRAVFVVSFAFALAGLAVLGLLVPDLRTDGTARSGAAAAAAKTERAERARRPVRTALADPRLRRLLLAAGLLSVVTIGDGFLYLSLLRRDDFAARYFPLLFVGTSLVYLALAVPLGRRADRVGGARVFVLGHLALLGAYVAASGPFHGPATTLLCLGLLGAFYAATDGVLAALAGGLVPASVRGSGIAAAQTVVAGGRLLASLLFGLVWTLTDRDTALALLTAGLVVALLGALRLVRGLDLVHPLMSP